MKTTLVVVFKHNFVVASFSQFRGDEDHIETQQALFQVEDDDKLSHGEPLLSMDIPEGFRASGVSTPGCRSVARYMWASCESRTRLVRRGGRRGQHA